MRDGLVYKARDNGASVPSPAPAAAADGEGAWRDWNIWADARADARIQFAFDQWLCGLIAEAVTTEGNELLDIVREGFRKRDREIAELRGKVDMLASLLSKGASADVVPLPGARKHA